MSGSSSMRLVSVAELCDLLGLSRTRFYALQKRGIFPEPLRTSSNRPVFNTEMVQRCQEVVLSRIGCNGEPVLFNRKSAPKPSTNRPVSAKGKHEHLVAALGSLGLSATVPQVSTAIASLPNAGADLDEAALIKAIFLILKKQGQS